MVVPSPPCDGRRERLRHRCPVFWWPGHVRLHGAPDEGSGGAHRLAGRARRNAAALANRLFKKKIVGSASLKQLRRHVEERRFEDGGWYWSKDRLSSGWE